MNKFDLTAGLRFEYFKQDTLDYDSRFFIYDSLSIPIYPIIRTGIHYELTKSTHLRASIGQGIRFPSVAERFVATSVGQEVIIFPNQRLNQKLVGLENLELNKFFALEIGKGH